METSIRHLSAEHPFAGLRPFDFADAPFFFGREDQFYGLYRLLDLSRFVAVIGSSGSGKSSLVRAGLLPLLRDETAEERGRTWRHVVMTPGDAPLSRLAKSLADLVSPPGSDELAAATLRNELEASLRGSRFGLGEALDRLPELQGSTVLIVIDQFEELFRYVRTGIEGAQSGADTMLWRNEAASFVELLLELTRTRARPAHVMITMRSDFVGDCAQFHGLPEAVSAAQFLTPSLTRDQQEEAIRGPIEKAGAAIEPALVERLLNVVGSDLDQLPVLQHCLLRLWNRAGLDAAPGAPRRLTLDHYRDVGGISGALSQHADEVMASQPGLELAVQQVFRALSEVDKEGRATRRALRFKQLLAETGLSRDQLVRVLDRFRADDCSFIVPSLSAVPVLGDDHRIDVVHEALLRRWNRISAAHSEDLADDDTPGGWLAAEQRDGRLYRALLELLEGGSVLPLDQVEQRWRWWKSRPRTKAWAERYGEGEGGGLARVQRFLEDSRKALAVERARDEHARQREREEERRAIEADEKAKRERLEHAAAVEQQRLKHQAELDRMRADSALAARRRSRIVAVAMSAIAVVAVVLGGLAWRLKNEAVRTRVVAEVAQAQTFQTLQALRRTQADMERAQIKQRAAEKRSFDTEKRGRIAAERARNKLAQERGKTLSALKRAEAEKAAAEHQRSLASAAVVVATQTANGVVSDVAKRFRDRGVPVAVIASLLQRTQGLQSELMKRGLSNPDLHRSESAALMEIATTLQDEGDTKAALAAATRSRDVVAALIATDRRKGDWQSDLSAALRKIGDVRTAQGNLPEARKSYRAAVATAELLASRDPQNLSWQRNLSESYEKVGQALFSQGDTRDALPIYTASLKIRLRLVNADPKKTGWQEDLETSYADLGDALLGRGYTRDGLKNYREEFSIAKRLAATDAGNASWKRDLATAYLNLSDGLRDANKLSDSLEDRRQSLKIVEALANSDPGNASWQSALSLSQNKVGYSLRSQGHLAEALEHFRSSRAIRERLAASDKRNAAWQSDLSTSYYNVGNVLMTQGNSAGALDLYRKRLEIVERLAVSDPTNETWKAQLVDACSNLADVLDGRGDVKTARSLHLRGLETAKALAQRDPENLTRQQTLSDAYAGVGYEFLTHGDPAGLRYYVDGIAIRERLAKSDPQNRSWQQDLASAYNGLGDVLFGQNDVGGALRYYRRGLDISKHLVTSDPDTATFLYALATSYTNVGAVLRALRDWSGALANLNEKLTITKRLAESEPSNKGWQRAIAGSHSNLGFTFYLQARNAASPQEQEKNLLEAADHYRVAAEIGQALVAADPGNAYWQDDLASFYVGSGDVLVLQKKDPEAMKAYDASLAIKKKLAEAEPDNASHQQQLAVAYNRVGNLISDPQEALKYQKLVADIDDKLAKIDPSNVRRQRELLIALANLGDGIRDAHGDASAQRDDWTRALSIARKLKADGKLLPEDEHAIPDLEKKLAAMQQPRP